MVRRTVTGWLAPAGIVKEALPTAMRFAFAAAASPTLTGLALCRLTLFPAQVPPPAGQPNVSEMLLPFVFTAQPARVAIPPGRVAAAIRQPRYDGVLALVAEPVAIGVRLHIGVQARRPAYPGLPSSPRCREHPECRCRRRPE